MHRARIWDRRWFDRIAFRRFYKWILSTDQASTNTKMVLRGAYWEWEDQCSSRTIPTNTLSADIFTKITMKAFHQNMVELIQAYASWKQSTTIYNAGKPTNGNGIVTNSVSVKKTKLDGLTDQQPMFSLNFSVVVFFFWCTTSARLREISTKSLGPWLQRSRNHSSHEDAACCMRTRRATRATRPHSCHFSVATSITPSLTTSPTTNLHDIRSYTVTFNVKISTPLSFQARNYIQNVIRRVDPKNSRTSKMSYHGGP